MKVLMLGWEYPPHIAGGLGTACEGLTTALARRGVKIDFVVPHLFGGESANHMSLLDSSDTTSVLRRPGRAWRSETITKTEAPSRVDVVTTKHRIPSFLVPYLSPEAFRERISQVSSRAMKAMRFGRGPEAWYNALIDGEVYGVDVAGLEPLWEVEVPMPARQAPLLDKPYATDIFTEVEKFTANVVALMSGEHFDVIHAHDWMTFPAGAALSKITKKPLITHVHSLEYDRSGYGVNDNINEIERFGVKVAQRVIAVSHYTQRSIEKYHGVAAEKIRVVHNGIYPKQAVNAYRLQKTWPRHVVLFLGRVTFQKGPDYFVEVASRVVPHVPDVLFVLAGNGDMLSGLQDRVRDLGLEDHFLFPGFLKGEDVEEMFSVADLYVMPSVSEPFGIAALEAINFNTPVIISKQSGVSEVLEHALRTDFWDLERMADLIINGLLHEELRQDMVVMAKEELRRLHWDASAQNTIDVYEELIYK